MSTLENMRVWSDVRFVPDTAKRTIKGGRLSGKTDINPMFRLKALTEQFGVCGIGWRYEIVKSWLEHGANDEVAAFVEINLYIKQGEWSAAIPGTGGSMFVAKEKGGLYTSDECYKMALTDAISVACKALGVAADVYWEQDGTKYDKPNDTAEPKKESKDQIQRVAMISPEQSKEIGRLVGDFPEGAEAATNALVLFLKERGYQNLASTPAHEYEAICDMLAPLPWERNDDLAG